MDNEYIFTVPPEGSLGLLAYGYAGLLAWRNAQKKHEELTGKKFISFYMEEQNPQLPDNKKPSSSSSHES